MKKILKPKFSNRTEISPIETIVVVTQATFTEKDRLRKWWHEILRQHGKYVCFAVFLILPSDKAAINYLKEYHSELDQISGDKCLVMVFTDQGIGGDQLTDDLWPKRIDKYIDEGFSTKLGKYFKVRFDAMPCMILFKDIRSADHWEIQLMGLETEEISQRLRTVFSIVHQATETGADPLKALEIQRSKDDLQKTGLEVIGILKTVAGKTLETAIELLIDKWISPKVIY